MRVVLDTNVLIAALISPHAPPDSIYRAWRSGRFELVTSAHQLDELRRASRYPKLRAILPAHRVGAMINNLQGARIVEPFPLLPADTQAEDPDDTFLLQMASGGPAHYLVTGDRRAGLLQRRVIGPTQILTPAAFCATAL